MRQSPDDKRKLPGRLRSNTVVQAVQGNFDHLMGLVRQLASAHNLAVDDLEALADGQETHEIVLSQKLNTEDAITDHGALSGLGDDDHPQYMTPAEHTAVGTSSPHHVEDHDHDGSPTQQLLAANTHGSPSADTHHNKSHAHSGADGSGTVAHADTTGKTANDHHNQDHATRHSNGGADEVSVENLGTAETDTSLRLAPDGAGGVEWGTGGTGGASLDVQAGGVSITDPADTLNFDDTDFVVSQPGAGEADVRLNYGAVAGTPAEGNHSHDLDDLTDVDPTGKSADDVLAWSGAAWEPVNRVTHTGGVIVGATLYLDNSVEMFAEADTPAQLAAADITGWDESGVAAGMNAPVVRVQGRAAGATANIHGIHTGGATLAWLVNINTVSGGEGDVVLKHESTTDGTASRRLHLPGEADYTLKYGDGCLLWYDTTISRWRIIDKYFAGTTTRSAKWFVTPHMGDIDDGTFAQQGTTPDLIELWAFAEASGRSGVLFNTAVPFDWASGTVEVFIWWYTSSSTGDVRWLLSVSELATGDTPTEVSDKLAASGTTVADSTTMKRTSLGTFTPSTAGDLLKVNLERNASVAADTATGAARVAAVEFVYTQTVPTGPQGPAGPSGTSTITVQEADSTVDAAVTTLDFGSGFDVTSSPAGEANVALDLSEVSSQHDALDHSTALGTAVIDDLSDVAITGVGSGDYMVYNGSAWANAAASDPVNNTGAFRKSIKVGTATWMFHDFLLAQAFSDLPAMSTGSAGAGAVIALATSTDKNHPGLISLNCGTTSTGNVRAGNGTSVSDLPVGGGVIRFGWWIKTPASLSDATNTYTIRVGITDALPSGSPANGARFNYSHGTNSGKWQAEVLGGGGSTTGDTTVSVVADTWYFLEVVINAGATAVDFYINEVFKVTVTRTFTGNINTPGGVVLTKSAGTSSRTMLWDGYYGEVFFTSDR